MRISKGGEGDGQGKKGSCLSIENMVAIAPILLGGGIRLWDDLRGLEAGYAVKVETAPSGTIHLSFRR